MSKDNYFTSEEKRQNSLANLKMWKPGQTGNPNGFARKNRISDHLNKVLTTEQIDIICRTLYGMGTGNMAYLLDPVTGDIRNPDIRWFAMLLEQIAGKEEYQQVTNAMQVIVERRDRLNARRRRRVKEIETVRDADGAGEDYSSSVTSEAAQDTPSGETF